MKTGYSVADAMTANPVTVMQDITIRDASKVMRDHDIGSLLVTDKQGALAGIIIAEDIVHRVTAEAKPSGETHLKDIMTTELVDIRPEADLYDAMVAMRDGDIWHLPVRDEAKKLVGFLTMKDVLKIEPELFAIMEEMAELSAEQGKPAKKEGYCEICGNYSDELKSKNHQAVCGFCYEDA